MELLKDRGVNGVFPFHVLAKPAGPRCNLRCAYCFYVEKEEELCSGDAPAFMSDATLERFVRDYIASQPGSEVLFAWQGGEPTLCGIDFFEKAFELQRRYAAGKHITNAFQTNGVLIDNNWATLFQRYNVLVGLSIDGPERVHDHYRRDRGGHPTFSRVMRAVEHLRSRNVAFNAMACVHAGNQHQPLEVYRFLRDHVSRFIQFIPVVERHGMAHGRLVSPNVPIEEAPVDGFSVSPAGFGRFLCAIFDEWARRDVGRVFVQQFDVALEAWVGAPSSLCSHAETCGRAMALEHNGDLYACDHYVFPGYRLGNIHETPLWELAGLEQQRRFGLAKRDSLPSACRNCPVLFACRGGCPKDRIPVSGAAEPPRHWLCEGYRMFFTHIDDAMTFMAKELTRGRPPANVMAWLREQDRKLAAAPGAKKR